MCKRVTRIYQSDKYKILACACSYEMRELVDGKWKIIKVDSPDQNGLYLDLIAHIKEVTQAAEDSLEPSFTGWNHAFFNPIGRIVEVLLQFQGLTT